MSSILHEQATIIAEFEALPDWESRYKRIIELGKGLEAMDEAHKTEDNKVRGCSSTVWLHAEYRDGRVYFAADSDAVIVRGLVALLLRTYSGHTPQAIIHAEPAFIEELGLNQHLSSNRANGLAAMVTQIKAYALAFQARDASS